MRKLSDKAQRELRSLSRQQLEEKLFEYNCKVMTCLCGKCDYCVDLAFSKTRLEVRLMEVIAQEAVKLISN